MGDEVMRFFAALAGALALGSAAQAATYDAYDSFNGTQGAGGFIYLKLPAAPGVPATQLGSGSPCVVTSNVCLQDGAGLPGAYKSLTTFSELTYTVPDDRLLLHPGAANPIAILFVAPEAADYDFAATFNVLDNSPSGVGVATLTNASGSVVATPTGFLGAPNQAFTRTGTITLAQGQFFGFILNTGGNYANDSTGVNFTLTSGGEVPEPATWALLILGFGAAGSALRRRRAAWA
jgi:hypothetical protein